MTVVVYNCTRGPVRIGDLLVPRWSSISIENLTQEQQARLMKAEAYGEVRCTPSLLPPVPPPKPTVEVPSSQPPEPSPPPPKKRKR